MLQGLANGVLWAGYELLDRGLLPDWLVRLGIRQMLRNGHMKNLPDVEALQESEEQFIEELRSSPIALEQKRANEQHYEVPPAYFVLCLGPALKYSACVYPADCPSLEQAETQTFELYAERMQLKDGLRVLDLGCGWGAYSLWMLKKFPKITVFALSNSSTQRVFIERRAKELGVHERLTVQTMDVGQFLTEKSKDLNESFDAIVSVEMLEHCKNYHLVMARLADLLRPGGKLFVHIFTHHWRSYHFLDSGPSDWMARTFFSGGTMPHHELLQRAAAPPLVFVHKWKLNGMHYHRTLEAWLAKMDQNSAQIRQIFEDGYGKDKAHMWIQRWRTFYLACSELFAYNEGNTWYVTHYLWEKK